MATNFRKNTTHKRKLPSREKVRDLFAKEIRSYYRAEGEYSYEGIESAEDFQHISEEEILETISRFVADKAIDDYLNYLENFPKSSFREYVEEEVISNSEGISLYDYMDVKKYGDFEETKEGQELLERLEKEDSDFEFLEDIEQEEYLKMEAEGKEAETELWNEDDELEEDLAADLAIELSKIKLLAETSKNKEKNVESKLEQIEVKYCFCYKPSSLFNLLQEELRLKKEWDSVNMDKEKLRDIFYEKLNQYIPE